MSFLLPIFLLAWPAPPARASAADGGGDDAPSRALELTQDAAGALRARDYPTALRLAGQAVALNPRDARALNYRAMALSLMRRYAEAVRDASAALRLAPGNTAILHTRSWALSKLGQYEEGLRDASAASAEEPTNAFLYQDVAFASSGLGDRPAALDALRRSAALDPRFQMRLERAVQLPQGANMASLFDDGAAASIAPPPPPTAGSRSFMKLALLSLSGGLLIALAVLHIVSASWRERVRTTVRRAIGSSPSAAAKGGAAAAPSGAFWSRYELVQEIGFGGMGVVYEAIDRSLRRRVAVKRMRDEIRLDARDRRLFVDEARLVARLHHPNIVDIYGIVEEGADVYLVFEFVAGETLQDVLRSDGPLGLPRARGILKKMADAVAHAHERGVIHRDLKPSNVMLTPEGGVKVMDFGVAREAKDALTRRSTTNGVAGTPPYMSPEQERGIVRKECDVYALGVCLYEMTTGRLPFGGSDADMLAKKIAGEMVPPSRRVSGLPDGLDAVVVRALAPDPERRFRAPAELVAALDAVSIKSR